MEPHVNESQSWETYPVEMGGNRYNCDLDNSDFWSKVNRGVWEPETFKVLDQLILPDTTYCDIGAWIGPTVLYAAKKCRRVFCLEPDRKAFMYLLRNIESNYLKNVLPFNLGLAGQNGVQWMASPRGKLGDSMTSILYPEGKNKAEALCLNWHTWLHYIGNPPIDVIKVDIEGAEFEILPDMANYLQRYKPSLYLSFHPQLLEESIRVEKMEEMVFLFQVYSRCYDRKGHLTNSKSFFDAQTLNHGNAYLLIE